MVTVNGYTAERMKQIEDNAIANVRVEGEDLIVIRNNGTEFNAGRVQGFPGLTDLELYDPVGVPKPYTLPTIPSGYGRCDGLVEFEGTDYPKLAAAYGTGTACINGACAPGKFRLPNLRGRFLVGRDATVAAFSDLHELGGSKDATNIAHTHTATSTQPMHAHIADQAAHSHVATSAGGHSHGVDGDSAQANRIAYTNNSSTHYTVVQGTAGQAQQVSYTSLNTDGTHTHVTNAEDPEVAIGMTANSVSTTVASSGVTGTDANLPPYRVVNWIMRLA